MPDKFQEITNEWLLNMCLQDHHIVAFLGVVEVEGRFGAIFPEAEHGNARVFVGKNPLADRLDLLIQAGKGLKYLHERQILHGDLKGVRDLLAISTA